MLPWLIGRAAAVGRARQQPALRTLGSALRGLHVDTLVHDPRVLRLLVDLIGADRLVVGSDAPFPHGDPDPVATVTAVDGLSDTQVQAILRDNAERLLRDVAR